MKGGGGGKMCMKTDFLKSKQGNTTNLNISFYNEKELLRWDSNPRHMLARQILYHLSYEAAQLPGSNQRMYVHTNRRE